MYKVEDLMEEMGVCSPGMVRVHKWEQEILRLQRRLGKNPSPNKAASQRYHLGLLIRKVQKATALA